jgi:hypothetical protein
LFFWFRDNFYSFYRVQGSSMDPTLKNGDIVLVRKADAGILLDTLLGSMWRLVVTPSSPEPVSTRRDDAPGSSTGAGTANTNMVREDDTERARTMRLEEQVLCTPQYVAKLYARPPFALPGHVVIFQSPMTAFPSELCIKRVMAVGGQYITIDIATNSMFLPPYTLFVQGDNPNQHSSLDSRNGQHGPVSKNMLVGIAEYVVWPPRRWQRITRIKQPVAAAATMGKSRRLNPS